MQYYMLDKNDISVVRGIVSSKDVMRELEITNAQFHKMLRNEETYKGCILLPIETDEEERRKVTSEDDEQFQLLGESKTGIRYYITSYLRVVSVDIKGNQKEMKAKKETESIYRVVVNFKEGKRYLNVLFEAYKAFVGEIEKNDLGRRNENRKPKSYQISSDTRIEKQEESKNRRYSLFFNYRVC